MLLTLGLHKNSLVRSYSEHRILTPKIPKQSGKTVVTILVTTVSIFSMVLSASRRLPCGERPEGRLVISLYLYAVRLHARIVAAQHGRAARIGRLGRDPAQAFELLLPVEAEARRDALPPVAR